MCRPGARRNPTKSISRDSAILTITKIVCCGFNLQISTGATLAIVSGSSEGVKGGCGGKGDSGDLRLGCGKARFAVEQELQPLPARFRS